MAGLLFFFIVLPLSIILFLLWCFSQKKYFVQLLIGLWVGIIILFIISTIAKPFYTKKVLDKEDFYGEYVIDRNYFSGKQADWQYNNFRFEIKDNDSIYFYTTEGETIHKTFKGTITTPSPYQSARLSIHMEQPIHHILNSDPTIYREVWGFFLVFNSPEFNNMYFRKGKWKEIK
ncbi:hypothetical protein [uncultured Dokdonia sp.]|uniref:hypothetical protein n=1 Tax=uncultured Dokdonia sp. TaxID=575653 RepID=UPI002617C7E2|nr:hypothetical protein [uncultured Dokdonia sp.]